MRNRCQKGLLLMLLKVVSIEASVFFVRGGRRFLEAYFAEPELLFLQYESVLEKSSKKSAE
jgi:hypothetical protein